MFSKKATKIDEIFTVDLTLTTYNVKSTVKILSNFVAFLENTNFNEENWYLVFFFQSFKLSIVSLECVFLTPDFRNRYASVLKTFTFKMSYSCSLGVSVTSNWGPGILSGGSASITADFSSTWHTSEGWSRNNRKEITQVWIIIGIFRVLPQYNAVFHLPIHGHIV